MPSKKSTKETKTTKSPARKTTAKPAAKTPARASTKVKEDNAEFSDSTQTTTEKPKSIRVRKTYLLAALSFILLGLFLYAFRSWIVAAVVNGQPISRLAVIKEAEKQSGKQALNTLVRNALIEQEAKKKNITVSDKEVNDEIKKVETTLTKQGQKLDDVLAQQGMTRDDLKKLIRLDKMVSKMVEKDVKVSDKDVQNYIDKNKDILPQGQKEDELKKTVKERLKQQQLSQKVQEWLEKLQSQASITKFVSY